MTAHQDTRLVFVLWSGTIGGAETFTAALCRQLRDVDVDARIAFVCDPGLLEPRLRRHGVPYEALGLSRGRQVVPNARPFARLASRLGPDGAVLVASGFLAGALRTAGYRAPIAAVSHGRLLQARQEGRAERAVRALDRAMGAWAVDAEVAVSDFMADVLARCKPRPRNVVRIYNGVNVTEFRPREVPGVNAGPFTVGAAGRLIPGKGMDDLVHAFARLVERGADARLRIAGDGPMRPVLVELSASLGVAERTSFEGWASDMPAFWNGCDLSVVPSREWIESFSMAAAESMACGLPLVASRNGGLPELVAEGETGLLFEPGNVEQLADALHTYSCDEESRTAHGTAARARCEERFSLEACAAAYLDLFVGDTVSVMTEPVGRAPAGLARG